MGNQMNSWEITGNFPHEKMYGKIRGSFPVCGGAHSIPNRSQSALWERFYINWLHHK
jgi:hypothetical protein